VVKYRPTSWTEFKRVFLFGLVGAFNTLLDFAIYNVLSGEFGFSLVRANIISTTVAMIVSFFANKHVVFKKTDGHVWKQALSFWLVTAFGLYILQTGTIWLLTSVWHAPLNLALYTFHFLGVTNHDDFIIKNGAKAIGTCVSLIWNYIMYKRVVFN
jgi:putative flippase GtrA